MLTSETGKIFDIQMIMLDSIGTIKNLNFRKKGLYGKILDLATDNKICHFFDDYFRCAHRIRLKELLNSRRSDFNFKIPLIDIYVLGRGL